MTTLKIWLALMSVTVLAWLTFGQAASAIEVPNVYGEQLLSNAATDETVQGSISADRMLRCRQIVALVVWSSGVSSGAIEFETAESTAITGGWAPLATATYAGEARTVVNIPYVVFAFRPRVDTVIVGGTGANVYVGCN